MLVGLSLFSCITVWPCFQSLMAMTWEKTPCVIDASHVSRSTGKGTTYSVDITYHYRRGDRRFTSDRYSFSVGKTAGRASKEAIVRSYPSGSESFCFVNPNAPEQAVIDRGLQLDYLFGLFGLIFVLPGGLGLAFRRKALRQPLSNPEAMPVAELATDGPRALKPAVTPLGKFMGVLAFNLIWNGVVGVFVYVVFFDKGAGHAPFFAKAIICLFALIGVLCLFAAAGAFLALFNPRVRLTAPATRVPLGGEFSFSWNVTGRTGMLRKLTIVLEAREEAIYKRGTQTSTDTKIFARIPIVETSDRELLLRGNARVAVPAALMHTFEATHNKVLWRLKVSGEIPRWPDVADEYPIVVLPLPLAG
jgi:hypothetical protein